MMGRYAVLASACLIVIAAPALARTGQVTPEQVPPDAEPPTSAPAGSAVADQTGRLAPREFGITAEIAFGSHLKRRPAS